MNLKQISLCLVGLAVLTSTAYAEKKMSTWEATQKAVQEKATEVKEAVSEKLEAAKEAVTPYAQAAKEAVTPYAKAAKEKITEVAGKVEKAVSSGMEKLEKKTEEAKLEAAEKMLRTVAAEPKLPAFSITNIYGKQLKLKIRDAKGKKLEKIYIDPGDNYTMNTIPEVITASYRDIKNSQNGLVLNPERLQKRKGIKHVFLTVWLSLDKAQFDNVADINKNISIEQINKAKEAFEEWWEEFEQTKAEKTESTVQEIKKTAKEMKKGYKDVARKALEVQETLEPYIKMAE